MRYSVRVKVVLAGAFLAGTGTLVAVGANAAMADDGRGTMRLQIVEQADGKDCPWEGGAGTTGADTR